MDQFKTNMTNIAVANIESFVLFRRTENHRYNVSFE